MINKKDFVKRLQFLMKRERIKPGELIAKTTYEGKRSTFYRHIDLNKPDDLPGINDVESCARALNTSFSYLAFGRGAKYVSTLELDDYYDAIEMVYDSDREAYLVLLNVARMINYDHVELIADVALSYVERMKSL